MKTTMVMGLATMLAAMTGCAAAPASDGAEADSAEIQGDVLFATATLDVDSAPAAGDPACADQLVGTKDPYCAYPFELGPTKLGWATQPYRLNRETPAKADGFASVASKVTAIVAKPALAGLGGRTVVTRAHRLVAEAIPANAGAPACGEWSTYFLKAADGSWLPRIEVIRAKLLPALVLHDGDDIGDDGLSTIDICKVSVAIYQQTTALAWTGAAFEGVMHTPIGKDGRTLGLFSHGSYQLDFVPEESVSMPTPAKPAGFALELSHRTGK